jgi:Acetyltransferase (GNAT) domain
MGNNVKIFRPAPRDLWQKVIFPQSGALLSHTPLWLDTICAVDGWADASRLYMWPSGQYLVLPMVGKRLGGLATIEDSFPPGWGFGGVIGLAKITAEELAIVFADLASSRSSLRLHICPNCLQGDAWSQVIQPSSWRTVIRQRNAHVIDLEGGPNAVWKRFSQSAKWSIRKAEKQSLEVECDTTGQLLGVVEELWLLSTQRWAAQSGKPVWLTRKRARRYNPESRWPQIAKRTDGGVAIWLARSRGEPAAAVVILCGPNDHYTRGAMRKELAGPTRANALLQWLAIQDACKRGARWYQMGQSGFGDDPVGVFKESFGARAYAFPEFHLERLPITYLTDVARGSAKHLITMVRGAMPPLRGLMHRY